MFNKLRRYFRDPYYALGYDMIKRYPRLMSDKFYLSVLWKMIMGYELDWKNPKTYNEKLQWLKLYDRNPLYTTLVDKYRVKKWVAERIGNQYIIPTLAVYNSINDINLADLPKQFVLKCNHDSGSVVICKNKFTFNLDMAKEKLMFSLNRNFYWEAREWPYKKVNRCVFAEEYLSDSSSHTSFDGLKDYKFFCFNGSPRIMYISHDRSESPTTDFFDMDFNPLPIHMKDPPSDVIPQKPICFDTMKVLASKLSQGIPHVRVDFYESNNRILFGEMTFYHNGGFSRVTPKEWNLRMGDWITLPAK